MKSIHPTCTFSGILAQRLLVEHIKSRPDKRLFFHFNPYFAITFINRVGLEPGSFD